MSNRQELKMNVPFFRPSLTDAEVNEVVECLRSGWLTTGPRTKRFESDFAAAVGATHAIALNSATAALHLAVDALGLKANQAVLVPTMTFAATAEVVRYLGAIPLLVDCDPVTLNMDLADAERKIEQLRKGQTPLDPSLPVVGIIPVHVGGLMMDMDAVQAFADRHGLWVVEDAAHALPAAYTTSGQWSVVSGPSETASGHLPISNPQSSITNPSTAWRRCGENTAAVTCFSFYANKTMTTGEGGMAVTDDENLALRIRQMSLHGLSHDAWKRYAGNHAWDYRIVAPGYKYNITDIASSLGIHQLARAEEMRQDRQRIARFFLAELADVAEVELPPDPADRIHSWHLFPIRLRLDRLSIDRNEFMVQLRERGVGCSVHWRPLHLHPYYEETFHWRPEHLPAMSTEWLRRVSLPLFQGMREEEYRYVATVVRELCMSHARQVGKYNVS
ncbi:MAG: DegT/DnrJ/EryC1/StrS family aminotransferase [Planctomycetaceae bacterium]|nr:DegT/DnrJ/EryC1/StrS family aminotransferase [Planctomycetaceae bacterium]